MTVEVEAGSGKGKKKSEEVFTCRWIDFYSGTNLPAPKSMNHEKKGNAALDIMALAEKRTDADVDCAHNEISAPKSLGKGGKCLAM